MKRLLALAVCAAAALADSAALAAGAECWQHGDPDCECGEYCNMAQFMCEPDSGRVGGGCTQGSVTDGTCLADGSCCEGCVDPTLPVSEQCVGSSTNCTTYACKVLVSCGLNAPYYCSYANRPQGFACGTQSFCDSGTCKRGCWIGGVFRAENAINPSNPCQSCQPSVATGSWSTIASREATHQDPCGATTVCHNGTCQTGCGIGGAFYSPDAPNPGNSCQACRPTSSITAWTPWFEALHTSCPADQYCHSGACTSGCSISSVFYAPSTANGPCQSCQPAVNSTAWSNANEATQSSCLDQQFCHLGVCTLGCSIDGVFRANGALNGQCQSCQPGVSTTQWSADNDLGSCGAGLICNGGSCVSGCAIGGVFRAPSAPNGPCQACLPAQSTTAWSSANEASAAGCAGGKVCHTGACTDGCGIGGAFYTPDAPNPVNSCQSCQPGSSATSWSNANEAQQASCSAGTFCHNGTCTPGCVIGGQFYNQGAANPGNSCQSCQPGTSTTTWTASNEGNGCGADVICHSGSCISGCFIGGLFYSPSAPNGSCQSCQPSQSTSAWSVANELASCGPAKVCRAGSCTQGCAIGGQFHADLAANPSNPCQLCEATTNTTQWTSVADGTNCGSGQVCQSGVCGSGCVIGGTNYASGQPNPGNACESCQPGVSTTTWTDIADGPSCGAGKVCHTGTCSDGCFIGGTFRSPLAPNPANPCESCQPGTNTFDWTDVTEGQVCGTNQFCHSGTCQVGCFILGTFYTPGAIHPSNQCLSCQPGTSSTDWSAYGEGNGCGAGKVCHAGACADGCFIGSAYRAPAAPNPGNSCQSCQPSRSTVAWSNLTEGTSCGTNQYCTGGTCLTGCFIAGTFHPPLAQAPGNLCRTCQPATTSTDWSNGNELVACGSGQVCHAGSCQAGCGVGGEFKAHGVVNTENLCQSCQSNLSTTAWSSANELALCASAQICHLGTCQPGCAIDGSFHADGAANGPCQVCQAASSTSAWTSRDEGVACGGGQVCHGGSCQTGCHIEGGFYTATTVDTSNPCQSCQPALSTSAFSPLPDLTSCGPSQYCSSGLCQIGCSISGQFYPDHAPNPANPCQICQAANPTAWSPANELSACGGGGSVCNQGTCSAGCGVGSTYYAPSAQNPGNVCQSCQPSVSTSSFSPVTDGTSCGNGQVCQAGSCGSGCVIASVSYPSDAINPANPCQKCSPGVSTSAWSTGPDGAACDADKVCRTGDCSQGCFVAGTFYAPQAANPDNSCEACDPATSISSWSSGNDGVSCGPDKVCSSGQCLPSCYILGSLYPPNAVNNANTCQRCDPAVSTTAWSNRPEGVGCDSAKVCHTGVCTLGCFIGASFYSASSPSAANPCEMCDPFSSTTGFSDAPNGLDCQTGMLCSNGQCLVNCYIGGALYSPNQANPGNPCQACDPAVDLRAWTSRGEGSTCEAGKVCHTGACSAGCAIGGVYYAQGATKPGDVCMVCEPAASTVGWSSQTDGAGCGPGRICYGGTCSDGCFIDGTYRAPDAINPSDICQACRPAQDTGQWSPGPDGATNCAPGKVCRTGQCRDGCFVDGAFRGQDTPNPDNRCQVCTPEESTTAWSHAADGTACSVGGTACKDGRCVPECQIGGQRYSDKAPNPVNPCEYCNTDTVLDGWSYLGERAPCGERSFCQTASDGTHQCLEGCVVGSQFYLPGAWGSDAESCQICRPAVSTAAFAQADQGTPCAADTNECTDDACDAAGACLSSPRPNGTSCGVPQVDATTTTFCFDSQCELGCLVEQKPYRDTQQNPLNRCQICNPAKNTTGWSQAISGADCSDGTNLCMLFKCNVSGACVPSPDPTRDQLPCGPHGEVCVGGFCTCSNQTAERCDDGFDNDCDGEIDCEESVCANQKCATANLCFKKDSATCQDGQCKGELKDCSQPPIACRQPGSCDDPQLGECLYPLTPAGSSCVNERGCPGLCTSAGECDAICDKAAASHTMFACGCGSVEGAAPLGLLALLGLALLRRRRSAAIALALAVGVAFAPPRVEAAAAKKKRYFAGLQASPAQVLAIAHKAYDGQDFQAAAGLAERALAAGGLDEAKRLDALTLKATALSLCAEYATAAPAFRALLEVRPDFELSPTAPAKAADVLRQVKAESTEAATRAARAAADAKAAEEARLAAQEQARTKAAAKASRRKIAVLTLKAGPELDQKTAELLTDMLSDAIQRRPNVQVISSKDIESTLGFERQKQLLGCSDATCLAEIGGALGVDKLVTGTLGKLGNSTVLSVQLLDAKKSLVDRRFSARAKNATSEAFLDVLGPVVEGLFGETPPSGEMYVADMATEAPRKAPFLVVKARGQIQMTDVTFAGAGAAMVGLQPVAPLRISVGGLFAVTRQGALVNISWIPVNADGQIYPVIGIEAPIFFNDPISVALGGNVGVEWAPIQNFAIGLEIPVYYFFTAPYGKLRWNAFAAGTASVRF